MPYTLPAWANTPSTATPLSAANLTELNSAIQDLDSRATTLSNGKVDKATLTTKGDLYVATAAGTVTRIGAGTDGQVLSADSTQPSGIKWITGGGVMGVNSLAAGDSSITIGGTAQNPTVAVSASTLASLAPVASPTFTGTATFSAASFNSTATFTKVVTVPVTLTDAATIAVDASLGNYFRITLGGNRTMGAPTNATDGQKILFEIIQDATGSRTVTWTAGAAGFAFGTDVTTPTLTTTANKRDFVGFAYNSVTNLWYCLAVARGY